MNIIYNLTQNIQITQLHCVKLTLGYVDKSETNILTMTGFNTNVSM